MKVFFWSTEFLFHQIGQAKSFYVPEFWPRFYFLGLQNFFQSKFWPKTIFERKVFVTVTVHFISFHFDAPHKKFHFKKIIKKLKEQKRDTISEKTFIFSRKHLGNFIVQLFGLRNIKTQRKQKIFCFLFWTTGRRRNGKYVRHR